MFSVQHFFKEHLISFIWSQKHKRQLTICFFLFHEQKIGILNQNMVFPSLNLTFYAKLFKAQDIDRTFYVDMIAKSSI